MRPHGFSRHVSLVLRVAGVWLLHGSWTPEHLSLNNLHPLSPLNNCATLLIFCQIMESYWDEKGQGLDCEVLIGLEHHAAPGDKMESDISFIAPPFQSTDLFNVLTARGGLFLQWLECYQSLSSKSTSWVFSFFFVGLRVGCFFSTCSCNSAKIDGPFYAYVLDVCMQLILPLTFICSHRKSCCCTFCFVVL